MRYAPIVLFTYNRPLLTERTIYALSTNKECKDSELYIFSDAPKSNKDVKAVEEVRRVIEKIDLSAFKEVHKTYQKENKGLAKSVIDGVNAVFESHDSVIVLEDDCEVSPYFLNYMNGALNSYKDNPLIGSITGYSPFLRGKYKDDVYAVMRSCSWGWGTWRNIWSRMDFSMPQYFEWKKDIAFIRKMNRCGNDRMYRLIRQVKYSLQSWSIRFGAYLVAHDLLTVYPRYSYIMNKGLEEGGVHSSANAPQEMKVGNNMSVCDPVFPVGISENKEIEKEFYKIYGGSLLGCLKRIIYVYGGENIIDAVREKRK